MDVQCRFDFQSVAIEREQLLTLMVRIDAPAKPREAERRRLNLGLVLDRSGSMGGEKVAALRFAAHRLVDQLTPTDQISIVTFDHIVETVVPPQPVVDKPRIQALIDQIHARGTTNLSGGLLAGIQHVSSAHLDGGLNRVLLLTDGQANDGVVDAAELRAFATQARQSGRVSLSTFGFGADFHELVLESLADEGGGAFYFIEGPEQLPATFREELGELLSVVGQNLTVDLHARAPVRVLSVLNGYRVELLEDGMRVYGGDLFENERREVLARLWIPRLPDLGTQDIGVVNIDLEQVVSPVSHQHVEIPIRINFVELDEAPDQPDPEIDHAATLLAIAELRQGISVLLQAGKSDAARDELEKLAEDLRRKGKLVGQIEHELNQVRLELQRALQSPELGRKQIHYQQYRQSRGTGPYRRRS